MIRGRISCALFGVAALVGGALAVGRAGAAAAVPATTLYAAPSAVGAGDCLTAATACSLDDALAAATPGAAVLLTSAGDAADPSSYYVGNWTLATTGTSAAAPVWITAAPGLAHPPVLDGNRTLGATCSTSSCGSSVLTISAGVYANVSAVTIQDANAANGRGGGINDAGGVLKVARTTFAHNVVGGFASDGGAISVNGGGTLTVASSTFDSNSSGFFGGAIGVGVSSSGSAAVQTSTFVGNSAGYDGYTVSVGGYYGNGGLTVTNSTFSGGGVYSVAYNGGSGTVTEAGNVFDGYCSVDPNVVIDAGYNVGLGSGCENGGPGDDATLPSGSPRSPALTALADNGGLTQTMALRKIVPNPAIRAIPANTTVTINGSSVPLCPATDQRGVTNTSADGCHAGAVQLLQALPVGPRFLYAAPAAVGAGDCVAAASACTLGDALMLAGPGTTIRLTSAGDRSDPSTYYVGNWTIATGWTTAAKPVTITAAPGLAKPPVLDGDNTLGVPCPTSSCGDAILTVGSGVHAALSDLVVQDAGSSGQHGGGVDVTGGHLSVTRSTFAHNTVSSFASDGGAISVNNGGTLDVSSSTFDSNSSAYFSGAIGVGVSSYAGTATVRTSTFNANTAGYDGAAVGVGNYYGQGDLTVIASTFSGSGVVSLGYNGGGGTLTVAANLFYGGCSVDPSAIVDAGYNVGTDASCENGGPGDDSSFPVGAARSPAMGPLASNGGPTKTMILRPSLPADTAIGAIPDGTAVTIGTSSVALCPAADQTGAIAAAGPCQAGALQKVGKALRPVVTAISPTTGPIAGGATVDITGRNFLPGATVVMGQGNGPGQGAIPLTDVAVVSSTELTATVPAVAKPGGHRVYVTTSGGTSATGAAFTYQ